MECLLFLQFFCHVGGSGGLIVGRWQLIFTSATYQCLVCLGDRAPERGYNDPGAHGLLEGRWLQRTQQRRGPMSSRRGLSKRHWEISTWSQKTFFFGDHLISTGKTVRICATSKVAPLPLPLLALKSSVATATRYSSSKVARYCYFTTKVAALPATRYFEQRVNFFRSYVWIIGYIMG